MVDEDKQYFTGWRLVLDRLLGVTVIIVIAYIVKVAIERM